MPSYHYFSPPSFPSTCILLPPLLSLSLFFFFNDTATTEIYTLSLHDALPISIWRRPATWPMKSRSCTWARSWNGRSEEHTSELQSHHDLVCRLLLEKKKKKTKNEKKRSKQIEEKTLVRHTQAIRQITTHHLAI